ncbi:methylenetetrahydrofolate reductase [Pseudoclavibacter chungangensis]|uniref:Methylenetetrahydrofolate reductase n=1 Tax=Pseudoclavibacter chungangensis TaxID=587635 RepID=A0A7J5C2M2_9MICO|nr:methylenetetrahydrofolate reductase [Pseudoclavibacter chungangensis]KAB1660342.1 methylenetetrahydrofolate reductase [Pseudoclavibacter chungangensis]NYJ65701.1 methylenetetrahydrofolate reductase (NADPH) [Pseudoclavibacter chungangensis]
MAERIEIVPVAGVVDEVRRRLPVGTTVTVTALPAHGIEPTVAASLELARHGFDAVPHLAAAQIPHLGTFDAIMDRLADSPIRTVFAVGGDGVTPQHAVPDGLVLLERIRETTDDRFRIGVAAYPEGHPAFDTSRGIEVLRRKAPLADHAVTQMCFDGARLGRYATELATAGVPLPLWFGVPGRVGVRKLAGIAMRIGVGRSLAFAKRGANRRLLGAYDPSALRADALATLGTTAFAGFHVYSFNAFDGLGALVADQSAS